MLPTYGRLESDQLSAVDSSKARNALLLVLSLFAKPNKSKSVLTAVWQVCCGATTFALLTPLVVLLLYGRTGVHFLLGAAVMLESLYEGSCHDFDAEIVAVAVVYIIMR